MTYKKAPFKGKLQRVTSISFRCECTPSRPKKYNDCGKLLVIDFGDGEVELDGVYLKAKSVEKLLKFLLESRRGEAIIKLGKIK